MSNGWIAILTLIGSLGVVGLLVGFSWYDIEYPSQKREKIGEALSNFTSDDLVRLSAALDSLERDIANNIYADDLNEATIRIFIKRDKVKLKGTVEEQHAVKVKIVDGKPVVDMRYILR